MSEFCLDCLQLTAVEPAADAREGFLGGNRSDRYRLQGPHQDLLSGRLIQSGFDGFQSVTRFLDLVHPLAQGKEVVLDLGEANRLAKDPDRVIEIVVSSWCLHDG